LIGVSICCLFICCFVGNQKRDGGSNSSQPNIEVNIGVQDTNTTENLLSETKKNQDSDNLLSLESGGVKDNGEPREEDVCFGNERHPGTRDWRKAIKKYVKENPSASYDPSVYNSIKKRLRDRRFFIRERSSKSSKWREATKKELISNFGEAWKDLKSSKDK
jgi:hypothetical protein